LISRVVAVKPYAERLFTFSTLGQLENEDAARAIRDPALEADLHFSDDAIDEILTRSEGYPYFIQLYGKMVWRLVDAGPVTRADVIEAAIAVDGDLDTGFFKARISLATAEQIQYLRAMAEAGAGPHDPDAAREMLGLSKDAADEMLEACVANELVYQQIDKRCCYTVPQFDRFLKRHYHL
jgi:Holliday junction resolvasome RuvABC ATP-dependent DNA helicase subunit